MFYPPMTKAILLLPFLLSAYLLSACSSFLPPTPQIIAEPPFAQWDQSVNIRLVGLPVSSPVTVRATMPINHNGVYRAQAAYLTDAMGTVDLSATAPISGSYNITDGQGLFWSMKWADDPDPSRSQRFDPLAPVDILLEAYDGFSGDDDAALSTAMLSRHALANGVQLQEHTFAHLRAKLFTPPGFADADPGSVPVVIVLGGSGGGFADIEAALLASRGFAALAVAYVPVSGPISLDPFDDVIEFLVTHPTINPAQIGAIGTSLGATTALLLGSLHAEITAVVAVAGSHIMWQYASNDPAFTYHGQALPSATFTLSPAARLQRYRGEPVDYAPAYVEVLAREDSVTTAQIEAASIDIARINGPILFLTGDDDRLLPATIFADMALAELAAQNFFFPVCHTSFAEAGHFSIVPNTPVTLTGGETAAGGYRVNYGGSVSGNAIAARQAWSQVLDFLSEWRCVHKREFATVTRSINE